MSSVLGTIILWLIVVAIIVVIAVYLLRWLYRRSTKETAFVRTGFGGEKVVINAGAFVIPVLHEMSPVNMSVMRIEVRRGETTALITRDRMRVDLIAEFFLRVQPTPESVSLASQTLGRRALQPDGIRDLFEGKFASSLRAGAAEFTLQELHEQRSRFMARVRELASEALSFNGLDLETVSLVDLDQTSLEYFDKAIRSAMESGVKPLPAADIKPKAPGEYDAGVKPVLPEERDQILAKWAKKIAAGESRPKHIGEREVMEMVGRGLLDPAKAKETLAA